MVLVEDVGKLEELARVPGERASFEKMSPVIWPALTCSSMRSVSGRPMTVFPLTASSRLDLPHVPVFDFRVHPCALLVMLRALAFTWSSVETRIQMPTGFACCVSGGWWRAISSQHPVNEVVTKLCLCCDPSSTFIANVS